MISHSTLLDLHGERLMYFLDTNICIDFLRGKLPLGYEFLKKSNPQLFGIPTIVEAELYLGVAKSAAPQKNRRLVEQFLLPFKSISFCSQCAREYAKTRAQLENQGKLIGPNDLLIAATALAHGAVLVTNNCSEFKRVPNLEIESWAEISLP